MLEQYEDVRPVADALAAAYPAHIRPEHVGEAAFLAAAELHYSHALEVRRPARRPEQGGSHGPLLVVQREACILSEQACDGPLDGPHTVCLYRAVFEYYTLLRGPCAGRQVQSQPPLRFAAPPSSPAACCTVVLRADL